MYRMYHALRTWFSPKKQSRAPQAKRFLVVEQLEDRVTPTATFQSDIGLNQVQSAYAYKGAGETVALLDTGINYNLPSLGGGVGTGHRVVYQYNFLTNTANALDDNGHGTFIANMIGSSDPTNPGIAPQVQFADLKVLDSNMNGTWTAVENALQWVINNKSQYNIVAVNMSFGSGNYTGDQFNVVESEVAQLKSMGVFIAAASGNDYAADNSQLGLSYPAVDPAIVSVGATWTDNFGSQTVLGATDYTTATNQIASFTQRDSALDILAPGVWDTAIGMNGTAIEMGGTSMATGVVTGAAVLMDQALIATGQTSKANEAGILQIMQSTGYTVVDNNTNNNVHDTGLTFKELNLDAAINAIVQGGAAPVLTPIANQTVDHAQRIETLSVSATVAGNSPITYSAQILPANTPVTVSMQGNQLTLTPAIGFLGTYAVEVTATANTHSVSETFVVTVIDVAPVLSPIASITQSHGKNAVVTLAATDPEGGPLTYAAQILPVNGQAPPLSAAVQGNQLTVVPLQATVGAYTVKVTATDGALSTTGTFTITLTNSPPTLAPIAAQSMTKNQTSLSIPLSAADADNDSLTFQASAQSPSAIADYQLEQQYGFHEYAGSFWQNLQGYNEKWIVDKSGNFYVLMPTGQLYRFSMTTMAATFTPANLVATLDPSVYTNPQLLLSATLPVPSALVFSFQGNQLTIQRPANLTGVFVITVTVNDGFTTTQQTFQLTLS